MSFPAVAFPDVEAPVEDLLTAAFADLGEDVTVGIGVPADWTVQSKPHIQVALDGTPIVRRQIIALATIRVTAWSRDVSEAKRLAALAQGLLCAHVGADVVKGALPLTGVLVARDSYSHAELASTTSRVTVRSAPIEPSGS